MQSLHWITSSISSRRFLSSCGLRSLPNPSLNPNPSTNTGSPCGLIFPLHRWRGISPHGNMSFSTDGSQENRSTPQPQQASSSPTFDVCMCVCMYWLLQFNGYRRMPQYICYIWNMQSSPIWWKNSGNRCVKMPVRSIWWMNCVLGLA